MHCPEVCKVLISQRGRGCVSGAISTSHSWMGVSKPPRIMQAPQLDNIAPGTQQKRWAHAQRGCTQSQQLKVHSIPYGSKIIQGEIMQIVNMFKLKWIMLKTSAQVAVNLFYSQQRQLRLFSPVRGPGGSGAGDTWRCSNKLPKAPAHALLCDNTSKLAGEKKVH